MRHLTLIAALCTAGCVDAITADEDDPLPDVLDAKSDAHARLVPHGRLPFGVTDTATIYRDEPQHAWRFELERPAEITIGVRAASLPPHYWPIDDTVLYVYRVDGEHTLVQRIDDAGGGEIAGLTAELDAGRYQVIVKGKRRSTEGSLALDVTCRGAGCPTSQCMFGSAVVPGVPLDVLGFRGQGILATKKLDWVTDLGDFFLRLEIDQTNTAIALAAGDGHEGLAAVDHGRVLYHRVIDQYLRGNFDAVLYFVGGELFGLVFDGYSMREVARIEHGLVTRCDHLHTVPQAE